jgi:YD repeat-containing protein
LTLAAAALLAMACGAEGEPAPRGQDAAPPEVLPARSAEPVWCGAGTRPLTLPAEPITCAVVDELDRKAAAVTWTWDPATRTLASGKFAAGLLTDGLRWIYDAQGRLVRYGDMKDGHPQFEHSYEYDDHGQLAHALEGEFDTRLENRYDGAGRLSARDTPAGGGGPATRVTFHYDASGRLKDDELDRAIDGTVERRTTRTYRRDCSLELVEQVGSWHGFANGQVIVREKMIYDDQDRLARVESDGGGYFDSPADGKVDEIDRWTYGSDGRLAGYERDGTADDVGGPADGQADERYSFSAGCAALVPWRRDVFRLPN